MSFMLQYVKKEPNSDLLRHIRDSPPPQISRARAVGSLGFRVTHVSWKIPLLTLQAHFGVSAMWAVMTVVVVFEFSVGATLGKGLNRGLATLVAGGLGLGAHHLAIVTVASTFIRFFPTVKARYDYGMLIFILTFCLVSISGLRSDEILELAQKRLLTILIGASTCVIVSICVYPVWAGEDLHKLVAKNIEKIGSFLEGFADECLRTIEETENGRSSLVGLNSVLDSKTSVEILANFARWEPGHGQFMYRHPWKQYLKIANLTRQCACRVDALRGYLNSKSQEEHTNLLQVIPVAAVASLLNDTVTNVENIADAIDELSSLANFKIQDSSGVEEKSEKKKNNISLVSIVIDGGAQIKQEAQSSSVQAGN
ncbi:hypothetical protein DH2020_020997 [Rehmannia glutinosa]|uniref:Aluminum-activated malate transporter n=1 Tax=Rehmannia glutinosa TaxID=99300 RepID=A0ABR0WD05_REHGL